jgi:hypothetical protein
MSLARVGLEEAGAAAAIEIERLVEELGHEVLVLGVFGDVARDERALRDDL